MKLGWGFLLFTARKNNVFAKAPPLFQLCPKSMGLSHVRQGWLCHSFSRICRPQLVLQPSPALTLSRQVSSTEPGWSGHSAWHNREQQAAVVGGAVFGKTMKVSGVGGVTVTAWRGTLGERLCRVAAQPGT